MARSQNGCLIRYAGMTGFDEIDVVFTSAEAHNRNAARLGSHHRAAISRVVPVAYAEVVASIASRSAGPGTSSNIDEFTETTSEAIKRGAVRAGELLLRKDSRGFLIRDGRLWIVWYEMGLRIFCSGWWPVSGQGWRWALRR